MCLAVPLKVEKIESNVATVESDGVKIKVDASLVPELSVGDYVLVHAGFAIEVLKPEEAEATLKLLGEMLDAAEEGRK
jgi:hydrogenase expression/formation protein HypC